MDSTHLNFPELDNAHHEFDCFNFEESPFGKVLELPSYDVENVYDFNSCNFSSLALPCQSNCYIERFNDFEDISADVTLLYQNTTLPSLHEDVMVDAKPLKTLVGSIRQYDDNHNASNCGSSEALSMIESKEGASSENGKQGRISGREKAGALELDEFQEFFDFPYDSTNTANCGSSEALSVIEREIGALTEHGEQGRICGRKRTAPLELHEIQKYFDFPISKAAKEMNVGLTVLKKRCRELNILRWPHRKIKSLKSLINNVKELGLTNEMVMLEEQKRLLEELPQMELTERTKKLRQACFKANYKKRRSLAAYY